MAIAPFSADEDVLERYFEGWFTPSVQWEVVNPWREQRLNKNDPAYWDD